MCMFLNKKKRLWSSCIIINNSYTIIHNSYFTTNYIVYGIAKMFFCIACSAFVPPHFGSDVCSVYVCVYWPPCPFSWLLIKRLLYAEKRSGGVCFDLLPIPSLYSFIARNPLPRSRSPLSCLSCAFCLFSLQTVPPPSPDGNSCRNTKQQKGLFPVVIWRR